MASLMSHLTERSLSIDWDDLMHSDLSVCINSDDLMRPKPPDVITRNFNLESKTYFGNIYSHHKTNQRVFILSYKKKGVTKIYELFGGNLTGTILNFHLWFICHGLQSEYIHELREEDLLKFDAK